MRILSYISYLGTYFNGWQRQNKGERTVQGIIEDVLKKIYKKKVNAVGAGRTDSGVHAKRQVFHFDPPFYIDLKSLKKAFNSLLPWDVKVNSLIEVPNNFHARKMVKSKLYLYRLLNSDYPSPFDALTFGVVKYKLDIEKIKTFLKEFEGEKDFYKFTVCPNLYKSTKRKIIKTKILIKNNKIYIFFEGNGFLRYQIRRMVGTLVEIGRGKKDFNWFNSLWDKNSKEEAGAPVEPSGLILLDVKYTENSLNYGNN